MKNYEINIISKALTQAQKQNLYYSIIGIIFKKNRVARISKNELYYFFKNRTPSVTRQTSKAELINYLKRYLTPENLEHASCFLNIGVYLSDLTDIFHISKLELKEIIDHNNIPYERVGINVNYKGVGYFFGLASIIMISNVIN